jgi:hypothetical protein
MLASWQRFSHNASLISAEKYEKPRFVAPHRSVFHFEM